MTNSPSITADLLLNKLLETKVVTQESLSSLLGYERNKLTLDHLEMALMREHVLSISELAALKGEVSGRTMVPDSRHPVTPAFSRQVSLQAGAVALDREIPTVVMIEDTESNLEIIRRAVGDITLEIWLCTATQFAELHKSCYHQAKVEVLEPMGSIYEIFDEAVERRASDIHLSVGQPPILRVDGTLIALAREPLSSNWLRDELVVIAGEAKVELAEDRYNADLAYSYGSLRFRLNIGADRHGLTLSARTLPTKIPTLDDLNLPQAIRKFTDLERGLVLVTGPTGSGKSTTLAGLLNHIAMNQSRHLITLEDPIEFHLNQGRSMVNQRELHDSFTSFPEGLRQALRQDPDVILVGEMRDLETIRTAVTAAETGHLVFGTLHTFDASSTVSRMVSSFPPEEQEQMRQQLAYVLKGIVSQTLIPQASGTGRVAAFEIMVQTPAISSNLRRVDGHVSLKLALSTGSEHGMQSMDDSLVSLVKRGMITLESGMEKARSIEEFEEKLKIGN